MADIIVDLPEPLYGRIKEAAERHGISMAQFVAEAVAERLTALQAKAYIEERAARGSLEDLHRILDRVPHVPPDPGDEL